MIHSHPQLDIVSVLTQSLYFLLSDFSVLFQEHINNPRYADDTTLMAESKEELKSLLMKVKEEMKKLA